MKATVSLKSRIFDSTARRQAGSNFVNRQAKGFKSLTRRRMIEGKPSGKIVPRRNVSRYGVGFERRHRRSRKGERPAVETMTLANAVTDEMVNETTAVVFIAPKINPETGTTADKYAEALQGKLDRPIMSPEDAKEAEGLMQRDGERFVASLI